MLMTLGMFIAGFALAFASGWLLTLVVLASLPVLGLTGAFYVTAIS
jgi:ABC-type amino acid transport system permease subunit